MTRKNRNNVESTENTMSSVATVEQAPVVEQTPVVTTEIKGLSVLTLSPIHGTKWAEVSDSILHAAELLQDLASETPKSAGLERMIRFLPVLAGKARKVGLRVVKAQARRAKSGSKKGERAAKQQAQIDKKIAQLAALGFTVTKS